MKQLLIEKKAEPASKNNSELSLDELIAKAGILIPSAEEDIAWRASVLEHMTSLKWETWRLEKTFDEGTNACIAAINANTHASLSQEEFWSYVHGRNFVSILATRASLFKRVDRDCGGKIHIGSADPQMIQKFSPVVKQWIESNAKLSAQSVRGSGASKPGSRSETEVAGLLRVGINLKALDMQEKMRHLGEQVGRSLFG